MLPRWHIILGMIFTVLVWVVIPTISPAYLALIFLSSFLIDFDHYVASVLKTKKYSLRHSFRYHEKMEKELKKKIKKGIKEKGDFHLFHTIEFHALIGILGVFITPFFYVFIGMFFHSLLDLIFLIHKRVFHTREYFFIRKLYKISQTRKVV